MLAASDDRVAVGLPEVALLVVALAFAAVGARGLPAIWRNEVEYFHRTPHSWTWGGALWRGWVRWIPAGAATFVMFAVLLAVTCALPTRSLQEVSLLAAIGALGFGIALWFPIALTGRPRRLIAPPLRHQRGALSEWFGSGEGPDDESAADAARPPFLDSS